MKRLFSGLESLRPAPWYAALIVAGFLATVAGGRLQAQDKEPGTNSQAGPSAPVLVLQITVDQLRGDALQVMAPHFKGGFAWLMNHGIVFPNAHYQHATTFTAVGHATLHTGGHPAQHGLVGNSWIDRETGKDVYCVDDMDHRLLDGQRLKTTAATSPRNLLSTTTGDELVLASGYRSRVFSVAGKDRAAILSGGRLGKAFWYNPKTGRMVTSSFYAKGYADWIEAFNAKHNASAFHQSTWSLVDKPGSYRFEDERASESGIGGMGATFPHAMAPVVEAGGDAFPGILRFTPFLDDLTADFAAALIENESLGSSKSGATDYLSVGFSAVDYVGHAWGPLSREYEDAVLQLDRRLGQLLETVDATVGLDRTLVILSADHGASPAPEAMEELGFPVGRIDSDDLIATTNRGLCDLFGLGANDHLVVAFRNPGLYFDSKLVADRRLEPETVQRAAAELVASYPGVAHAFSRESLRRNYPGENRLFAMAQRSFHPDRSGDVIVVQQPYWYLYKDRDKYAGMHGSPYNYDTHVPIVFAGLGLERRVVRRAVAPRDIAPTVCQLLGITAPTGSIGEVLTELFEQDR